MSIISDAIHASNPASGTPLEIMRSKRDLLYKARGQVIEQAASEKRGLLASEERDYKRSTTVLAEYDERISELEEQDKRQQAAAASRVDSGQTGLQRGYTSSETYHRGESSPSFFKDRIYAQRGDFEAMQRLQRNNQEVGLEARALGNTGAVAGSGGEFAPPAWMVEEYVHLARPGRVTADLFRHEPLPGGVSSVNIPRVATGTTTTVQSTQNTALSQTDITTNSLSATVVTIGGKQVVSQQLLDQSAIPFDKVVLEDLAADYARQIGTQVLTGTGTSGQLRGYLTPSSTNVVTWTQASPTIGGFYGQLAKLQSQINSTRYMPPDTVVMHPRRWAWFASGVDSAGRPLVVPSSAGQSFNVIASSQGSVEAGYVGDVLGMKVYTDPNIGTTSGGGSNQDTVLMFVRNDIWLWESEYRSDVLVQPYGDSLGVLIRLWNYSAQIPDRYLASLGQIVGTGLVTPVFAS